MPGSNEICCLSKISYDRMKKQKVDWFSQKLQCYNKKPDFGRNMDIWV